MKLSFQEAFYWQEAETVKSFNCRRRLYFLFTDRKAGTGVWWKQLPSVTAAFFALNNKFTSFQPTAAVLKERLRFKNQKSHTQKCINTFISQKTYTQNVWSLLQHYAGSSAHLYEVPHNCLLTANKNMTHKIQACTTASSHMTACFYVFIPREDTNRHVSSSLSSISSWVKRWPGHLTYISYKKVTMQ